MKPNTKNQLAALGALLVIYALLAAVAIALTPPEQFASPGGVPTAALPMPKWQLALANAVIVLVAYGLFGLAGLWFARRLGLPRVYREGAGWSSLLISPLLLGSAVGAALVIADRLFSNLGGGQGFPHPAFPLSLVASGAAAMGEEILFRGFVMGLWAFLFGILLRGWRGRRAALWIGNALAALAFSAAHIPAAMILLGVSMPAAIPPIARVEILVLNSLLGLVAGERYMRDGLVAAMGVHFWADVVWHVLAPLVLPAP